MYRKRGNHIITQVTEHRATLASCKRLEKYGYRVTYLPVNSDGLIDIGDLKRAMDDKTILVTIRNTNHVSVGTQKLSFLEIASKDHVYPKVPSSTKLHLVVAFYASTLTKKALDI